MRVDGNDNNDGSSNDPAHAFRTINKAIRYVAENYSIGSYIGSIRVAAGTYDEAVLLSKYQASTGYCSLIAENKNTTFVIGGIQTSANAPRWQVENFTFATTGAPGPGSTYNCQCVKVLSGSILYMMDCILDCTAAVTGTATATTAIQISGGQYFGYGLDIRFANAALPRAFFSIAEIGYCSLVTDSVVSMGTTPLQLATVELTGLSQFYRGNAPPLPVANLIGTAIGKRYQATLNSIINTRGGGQNWLPGSEAGTLATGAQYA